MEVGRRWSAARGITCLAAQILLAQDEMPNSQTACRNKASLNSSRFFSDTSTRASPRTARRTFILIALAFVHWQATSGVQKRRYFSVEPVLIFDIGKMRGVEFSIPRTRNLMSEKAPVRGRSSRIVRTGDHQRRYVNVSHLFAEIEIANSGATRHVTVGVCFLKHFQRTRYRGWRLLAESGREPSFDHGRSDRLHAVFSNRIDTAIPNLGGSNLGGRVTEHHLIQAFGRVDGQPHGNHSAHGQTAKMHAVQVQCI